MDITFGNTQTEGDMEKKVPMKLVEDVIVRKDESHPIEDEFNKATPIAFDKVADLYHGYLFTVVPKNFNMHNDITPPEQGFSDTTVLLWDTYDGMFKFKDDMWKKLRVQVPKDLLGTRIFKGPTDTYNISVVPAEWIVGEESIPPRYVE
jgi:hypothetical protein